MQPSHHRTRQSARRVLERALNDIALSPADPVAVNRLVRESGDAGCEPRTTGCLCPCVGKRASIVKLVSTGMTRLPRGQSRETAYAAGQSDQQVVAALLATTIATATGYLAQP